MRLTPRIAAVLLPAALAGCVFGQRGRPVGSAEAALLEVQNSYPGPVDVYVVRGGSTTATRVGQVSGNRSERFRIDPTIIAGSSSVTFVAQPPASQSRASTGSIVVRGGDLVRFNVTQDLRSSTVFVR